MEKSSSPFSPQRIAFAAVMAAVVGFAVAPAAAEWPDRPVTIVVPYGPGAANDLYGRFLANYLTKKFNQPFIVDNKPGAGSLVGSRFVSTADPDGYTFLEQQNAIAAIGLRKDVTDFDPVTDLTPVALMSRAPEALIITGSIPANNVKEFAEYIKANPDKAFYGIGAAGNARHMFSDKFARTIGAPMKAVSYNSGAPMNLDTAQGRTSFVFGSVSSAGPFIEAGTMRVIAYAGDGATPEMPKAPTLKEQGVDMEAYSWWGIWAPNGTPPDIVQKMNEAVNEATASPEFAKFAAQTGATPYPISPAEFSEVVKTEVQRVKDLMEETGITAD